MKNPLPCCLLLASLCLAQGEPASTQSTLSEPTATPAAAEGRDRDLQEKLANLSPEQREKLRQELSLRRQQRQAGESSVRGGAENLRQRPEADRSPEVDKSAETDRSAEGTTEQSGGRKERKERDDRGNSPRFQNLDEEQKAQLRQQLREQRRHDLRERLRDGRKGNGTGADAGTGTANEPRPGPNSRQEP